MTVVTYPLDGGSSARDVPGMLVPAWQVAAGG